LFLSLRISAVALALLCLVAPVTVFARSHATPTPSATPSPPPEDAAITLIARREFVAWQAGIVALPHYDPKTQATITAQKLNDTSKALGVLGTFEHAEWVGPLGIQDAQPGQKGYIYKMVCSNYSVYELLTMGGDGKIDGIFFRDKLDKEAPSATP
jgi:hypothetical protein